MIKKFNMLICLGNESIQRVSKRKEGGTTDDNDRKWRKCLGHLLETERGHAVTLKRAQHSPCIESDTFSALGRMSFPRQISTVAAKMVTARAMEIGLFFPAGPFSTCFPKVPL